MGYSGPGIPGPEDARRSRRRSTLRDLPVRGKLFAALIVPTAAFLAVAILGGVTWLNDAASYGRGVSAAKLARDVTAAVHEMQMERDLAVGFISSGRGVDPARKPLADRLGAQQRSADEALARFRAALRSAGDDLGSGIAPVSARAEESIATLPQLRMAVRGGGLPIGAIESEYSTTISNLLEFDRRIGQGRDDEELRYTSAVLVDLSNLKEINSQIRGQLYATAFEGHFEFGAADRLSSLIAEEQTAESTFRSAARPDDRARYDQIVNGQAVLTVTRISDRAIQRQRLSDLDIDPEQWLAASTTHIELLRTVETELLDNVVSSASDLRSTAWTRTALLGLLIVTITVVAVVWTLTIARTMTAPLRRLRTGALDIAHERLPRLIVELQNSDPEQVDTTIQSIGIDSRDEIGEVAHTFDELQHEAVRLATEQASLRRNVNTLFLSLSRRSQSLIERQIALIDRLEAAEENPLQLENLFKLDHLATRMRRNSENLLVLAGTGPGRRRAGPVSLGDVLQAATGEIEQYERVQIIEVPEVRVSADSVNHVVHLVAELLENAAQFSPPYLTVDLAATRLADGSVLITIDDGGLGMAEKELTAVNERLAEPPLFDFSIAQRLGLFVVARLADRHSISVRLTRSEIGGVRAHVHLPPVLLVADMAARRSPATGRPGELPGSPVTPGLLRSGGLPGAPAVSTNGHRSAPAASAGAPGAPAPTGGPPPTAGQNGHGSAPAPLDLAAYVPTGEWFRPRGSDADLADLPELSWAVDLPAAGAAGGAPTESETDGVAGDATGGTDGDAAAEAETGGSGGTPSRPMPSIEDAVAALERRRERAAARRLLAEAQARAGALTGDLAADPADDPFDWFVREPTPPHPQPLVSPTGRKAGPVDPSTPSARPSDPSIPAAPLSDPSTPSAPPRAADVPAGPGAEDDASGEPESGSIAIGDVARAGADGEESPDVAATPSAGLVLPGGPEPSGPSARPTLPSGLPMRATTTGHPARGVEPGLGTADGPGLVTGPEIGAETGPTVGRTRSGLPIRTPGAPAPGLTGPDPAEPNHPVLSPPISHQPAGETAGSELAGSGLAGSGLAGSGLAGSGLPVAYDPASYDHPTGPSPTSPDPSGGRAATPGSPAAAPTPPGSGSGFFFGAGAVLPPAPPSQAVEPEWIRGRLSRLYEGVHHARGRKPEAPDEPGDDGGPG